MPEWPRASVAPTSTVDADIYFDADHYADPLSYVLDLRAQGRLMPPNNRPIAVLQPQVPLAGLPLVSM